MLSCSCCFMDHSNGCNREGFFKKQLLALARATQTDGFNVLLNACKETQLLIDLSYPSIPAIDINQQQPDLQTISLDKYSKSILPDEWKHECPITCYGDENCLYRAASLLRCGNQSMYTEFRVRTVCELTLNEKYYLQPSITSFCSDTGVISKNVLLATSANFHRASVTCLAESSVEHVRVCFQLDCCETTKSGTYSNLWHMHGLASVQKQPIWSIYPEVAERSRPFYHKVIQPREACQLDPLIIMWTRALPLL